jgi:hypothetical protein
VNGRETHAAAVLADKFVLAGAALVLSVVGAMAWALFGNGAWPGESSAGPRYTHMHCPECGDEAPYSPAVVGKRCVSCSKGTYEPTFGSVREGGGVGRRGKVIPFVLVSAVLVQGLALLAAHRLRLRRQAAHRAGSRLLCICPFCRRKHAYAAARAGHAAVCARCKKVFTLPPAASA